MKSAYAKLPYSLDDLHGATIQLDYRDKQGHIQGNGIIHADEDNNGLIRVQLRYVNNESRPGLSNTIVLNLPEEIALKIQRTQEPQEEDGKPLYRLQYETPEDHS